MAEVTRADAEAQVRRTIGAYRDRVHEVRNDTDRLPPEGARIVDGYCSFDNDWQDLVQDAVREASFLGGMDDGLLLEYCAVCMELDGALGLDSWRIGRADRIVGVADLSRAEKIRKAIEYSDVLGEILEEVGDINALVAQMAVVSGVLIALAVTGYGAVAEALGFVLLAVGAAFSGTDLIAGIIELAKFFAAVDDARSEDNLKSCGRLFGDAVAKIGVDGLFFVMSMFGLRKASARLTTKTVADSSLNAGKWKGKRIEERELKIGEIDNSLSTAQETFISEIKVESFTPAGSQKPVEVYTDGYARVPKGKIDIYARGHIKKPINYDNKVEIEKQFRQLKKESPDLLTKEMQTEYKAFKKQLHNYERALGNGNALENAGISNTPENNRIIAEELLKAGRKVCEGNTKIQSELCIGEKKVILESWWIIDVDKRPYMTTIIIKGANK